MARPDVAQPVNMRQVNIGSEAEPKLSRKGYYWDEYTVGKVIELLHKYEELFPMKFTELKGIIGDLGS